VPAYTAMLTTLRSSTLNQPTRGSVTNSPCSTSVSSSTGVNRNPNVNSSATVRPVGGYHSDTSLPDSNTAATASSPNQTAR